MSPPTRGLAPNGSTRASPCDRTSSGTPATTFCLSQMATSRATSGRGPGTQMQWASPSPSSACWWTARALSSLSRASAFSQNTLTAPALTPGWRRCRWDLTSAASSADGRLRAAKTATSGLLPGWSRTARDLRPCTPGSRPEAARTSSARRRLWPSCATALRPRASRKKGSRHRSCGLRGRRRASPLTPSAQSRRGASSARRPRT